jgi:hypothetical protein
MRLTILLTSDPLNLTRSQLVVVAFPPCALLGVAVLRAKPCKTSENVTARLLYVSAGTDTAAERSAESRYGSEQEFVEE